MIVLKLRDKHSQMEVNKLSSSTYWDSIICDDTHYGLEGAVVKVVYKLFPDDLE
jgi:hypothetical protein